MSDTPSQADLSATAAGILQDLVRIPSVNPGLSPGGAGEAAMAAHIGSLMRGWGLEVAEREFAPGRFNAVGILRGTGGGRTLLFNGHMDTVGVEGMAEPFAGRIGDGRLYGRGAIDMKGALAATLAATEAVVRRGRPRRGDVVFTYVGDEEHLSLGTEAVVADIHDGCLPRPDGAINTEATGVMLGIGHKGYAWIEIETAGAAAHGSRPDLGVDAIVHMGRVLQEIAAWQESLASGPRHPLLGTGSVHASLIRGGREWSTYPESCRLSLERRTVPPETAEDVCREVAALLERAAGTDGGFAATRRLAFIRNPWQADLQSDVVLALGESMQAVTGEPVRTMTQTAWLDASLLSEAGIPTAVLGPAGEGLHALEEWVDVGSLGACAAIYTDVIERFCR
jgi:acetylornithine deacetylase